MSSYINKNSLYPFGGINHKYVNADGSSWPGGFNSTASNRPYGYSGVSNKVAAASASKIGGKRRGTRYSNQIRSKIKNIYNKYKMPSKKRFCISKTLKRMAKSFQGIFKGKNNASRRRSKMNRRKSMRGGYYQYGSNIPNTPSYSTGNVVKGFTSAMANPVTYARLPRTTNGIDNYNHYLNSGSQVLGSKPLN
jgi:ribosomal protein L37AE/L43A